MNNTRPLYRAEIGDLDLETNDYGAALRWLALVEGTFARYVPRSSIFRTDRPAGSPGSVVAHFDGYKREAEIDYCL